MIALIPARGGSKGLPGKNIKDLNGKPLIAYTIEAALQAKHITEVIVSTDSEEIAAVAKEYGANVPFLRPSDLAGDNSKAIDAYLYTIERLIAEYNKTIEHFVVLLPTSPLRSSKNIDEAIELFWDKQADSVISLTASEHPPTWYKTINASGIVSDFFENSDNSLNRQEVKETYIPNGAIYVFNYLFLRESLNYYSDKTYAYIMDTRCSIDIDTQLDFEFAEFLMKRK